MTRSATYRAHVDAGRLEVIAPNARDVNVRVNYVVDAGVVVENGEPVRSGTDMTGVLEPVAAPSRPTDADARPVRRSRRDQGATMRRLDVVALVSGVLLTGVAAASLWWSITGSINWELLKIVAPLALVAVGVVGLALSRNRE